MLTTKTCTKCRSDKPLEAFHRMQFGTGGRKAECKACTAIRNRARWLGQPYSTKSGPPISGAQNARNFRQRRLAEDPLWGRKQLQKHRSANPKKVWAWYASARARGRAKQRNVPYSISPAYLESIAVDVCPVLGFQLFYSIEAAVHPKPRIIMLIRIAVNR